MSKPLDLYLAAWTPTLGLIRPGGNPEGWRLFNEAAAEWRLAKRHFYAGYAMDDALHAAWGDGPRVNEAIRACLKDYACCIDESPLDSFEALASLYFMRLKLRYCESSKDTRRMSDELNRELAERLVHVFGDMAGAAAYAIRGVRLSTDMDDTWSVTIPDHELLSGVVGSDAAGRRTFSLPSAFTLLRSFGDYRGMQTLIDCFPGEFGTPGLRGWKLAVEGFLAPERRADLFAQAADSFAADVMPTAAELMSGGGSGWNAGENVVLWARYFRARAALAGIPRQPDAAPRLVREAAAHLEGTDAALVNPQVSRLRILVRAIVALVVNSDVTAIRGASRELRSEQRLSGEQEADDATSRFLLAADVALSEIELAPGTALASGRLAAVLDDLGRLPLIGPDVAEAVRSSVGCAVLLGPVRTWIHRTLEGVEEERHLQRIFYRLAQGGLPHYAQIRHGTVEYGKDVVTLTEEGGRNVLRMYQMKCGDLTMAGWREARNQLEEMFLVPFASIGLSEPVHVTVGVLVCNGHAQPIVDPVMQGWFAEQARDHHHTFEFMHLDDIASWIVRCGLIGEFRAVLAELGISTR